MRKASKLTRVIQFTLLHGGHIPLEQTFGLWFADVMDVVTPGSDHNTELFQLAGELPDGTWVIFRVWLRAT